jgi:hypothetical protein
MRSATLLLFSAVAFAQGTETKPKPDDYPVQAVAHVLGKPITLGAEFMVHSFSRAEESYIAPEFLVVEVALFAGKGETLHVDPSQFVLRINGKKQPLVAQGPGLVASSLTHPEWQSRGPRMQAGGGLGGIGVGVGRPRPTDIPGMPPQPGTRPPNPVDIPQDNPSGMERREHVKPEELCVQTALPSGEFRRPVSGFLYYSYKGKVSSIKSLELVYADAVVKLR